jgi:hypothetical protein
VFSIECVLCTYADNSHLSSQHVNNASRELTKFQADQNGKFKGLQRLVAAFVVEKNEEIEALQRNVPKRDLMYK